MNEKTRELSMDEMDKVFAGTGKRPKEKEGCFIYEVIHGDTLTKIANRFGTTKNKIKARNPQIKDDIIRRGDYLYIPEN